MQEVEQDQNAGSRTVEDYLHIIKRRRWWIAVPAFVVWALVWSASWVLPSSYRSETLIMVEPQRISDQYVVANVSDMQKRLESLAQQIESRSRLLYVMDKLDLFPGAKTSNNDELIEKLRKDIEVDLVQTGRGSEVNGFRVSYTSRSPQMAQKVVDLLTQSFMKDNLAARTQASEDTTDFLDTQLNELRNRLATQEETIRNFKNAHLGQLPAQMQPNLQILQGLQTRLAAENDALNRAKQQTLYYESLLAQYKSIQSAVRKSGGSPELPSQLDKDLARMRTELADLSGRYTEAHPDVKKLKQQIAATERAKRQLAAQTSVPQGEPMATSTAELDANSPMIQIESQLKANKMEVQQRERDITRLSGEIASFQSRIDQMPVREQQLSDITRDYEQTKKEYDSLLAKRNQSELATSLVQRQQSELFRVLDPPSLPMRPVSPNRLKLALIGVLGGMGLGIFIAGAKEYVDDTVSGETELGAIVPVAVLATIPTITTESERFAAARRMKLELAGAACILCVVISGLAVTYLRG